MNYNLILDSTVYASKQIFASFGNITALAGKKIDNNVLLKQKSDFLIIRSRTKVDAALLKNTKVRFIGNTVAGIDHIDLDYLKRQNINLASATGCNANAVAEYVINVLVNLADNYQFKLKDKTLAIIGVGNVGKHLNRKAQALGIKTLLNDPPRQALENLPTFVDLTTALKADIVSFHTPLTKIGTYPSYHLLNTNNANLINNNAIVINTARGGVIDEIVWQNIPTKANVIDCWENEPHINQSLKNNAYLATPHIAGHSIDAKLMGSYLAYVGLCNFVGIKPNKALKTIAKPQLKNINTNNLKTLLNGIYDFKKDSAYLDNPKVFEHYRSHYPPRYEWQHYYNVFKSVGKADIC